MYYRLGLYFAFAVIVVSCGNDVQKTMDTVQNMKSIAESADNATQAANDAENLRKERVKRGDTLYMPYTELQKYLPEAIGGYMRQEPEGGSVDVPGMAYSNAQATYVHPDGREIRVSIADYNNSVMGYTAAATMFSIKMKFDDKNETTETFQTDNPRINGYKRVGKTDGQASLTYGIAARFLVEINGTQNAGIDDVQALANKMNMEDLSRK